MNVLIGSFAALVMMWFFRNTLGDDYYIAVHSALAVGCWFEWKVAKLHEITFWTIMFLALSAFSGGSGMWWIVFAMMLFYIAAENGAFRIEKGE